MIKTSILRKLHRVLGVIIGVQVLMWTISGAVFVWNDIESVRGDDTRVEGFDLVRIGDSICYRIEDEGQKRRINATGTQLDSVQS